MSLKITEKRSYVVEQELEVTQRQDEVCDANNDMNRSIGSVLSSKDRPNIKGKLALFFLMLGAAILYERQLRQ